MQKSIDILLAVYNGEKYIRQQIESIMCQTYSHIHLWVRDNNSEDQTVKLVKELMAKYPKKISLLLSQINMGIIGNFSALLEHSQADYIMLSDADDIWLSEKVAKTMQKMELLENVQGKQCPLLVHTDLKVVDAHLNIIHHSFWDYSHLKPNLPHTLPRQLIQNQITGCTVMINRPLVELAKPIPKEAVMHDWWLGLCTATFGKADFVPEPTMLYRQHGKNDTGAKKYGFIPLLKQFASMDQSKRMQIKQKTLQQAEVFYQRYENLLNEKQKKIIRGFFKFQNANLFKKGYLMIRWGFYRTGFLRNLPTFLLKIKL